MKINRNTLTKHLPFISQMIVSTIAFIYSLYVGSNSQSWLEGINFLLFLINWYLQTQRSTLFDLLKTASFLIYLVFYVMFAIDENEVNFEYIEKVQNYVIITLIFRMLILNMLIINLIPQFLFGLGIFAITIKLIIHHPITILFFGFNLLSYQLILMVFTCYMQGGQCERNQFHILMEKKKKKQKFFINCLADHVKQPICLLRQNKSGDVKIYLMTQSFRDLYYNELQSSQPESGKIFKLEKIQNKDVKKLIIDSLATCNQTAPNSSKSRISEPQISVYGRELIPLQSIEKNVHLINSISSDNRKQKLQGKAYSSPQRSPTLNDEQAEQNFQQFFTENLTLKQATVLKPIQKVKHSVISHDDHKYLLFSHDSSTLSLNEKKEATHISEEQCQFYAQLRNCLNTILMILDGLKRSVSDQLEYNLDLLFLQTQQMKIKIQNREIQSKLLDITNHTKFHLDTLIVEIIDFLKPTLAYKEFIFDQTGSIINQKVKNDKNKLRQLIVNLISIISNQTDHGIVRFKIIKDQTQMNVDPLSFTNGNLICFQLQIANQLTKNKTQKFDEDQFYTDSEAQYCGPLLQLIGPPQKLKFQFEGDHFIQISFNIYDFNKESSFKSSYSISPYFCSISQRQVSDSKQIQSDVDLKDYNVSVEDKFEEKNKNLRHVSFQQMDFIPIQQKFTFSDEYLRRYGSLIISSKEQSSNLVGFSQFDSQNSLNNINQFDQAYSQDTFHNLFNLKVDDQIQLLVVCRNYYDSFAIKSQFCVFKGVSVDTAYNCEKAYQYIIKLKENNRYYELVIFDLSSGYVDEVQYVKGIKHLVNSQNIQVYTQVVKDIITLALTAEDSHQTIQISQAGFDGCLQKPLKISEVVQFIHGHRLKQVKSDNIEDNHRV